MLYYSLYILFLKIFYISLNNKKAIDVCVYEYMNYNYILKNYISFTCTFDKKIFLIDVIDTENLNVYLNLSVKKELMLELN